MNDTNDAPSKSLIRTFLDTTVPLRQRMGLTRPQMLHRWRKSIVRSHPQLLTTDLYPQETKMLLDAFREAKPRTYLEVGVFWGGTFKNVLQLRDELSLDTKCYGIDIWDEIYDSSNTTHGTGQPIRALVANALKRQNLDRFDLLTGLSVDVQRLIQFKIDFAFHDANHTYAAVVEDLELIHPLMSDGAMMLVHNAGTEYEPDKTYVEADGGPYQAILDLVKLGRWELLALEYRMAVLRRIP